MGSKANHRAFYLPTWLTIFLYKPLRRFGFLGVCFGVTPLVG